MTPDNDKIDIKRFFRVCNPSATLNIANPEDRKYYIDFSSVRSGNLIRELKRTITLSDDPTCPSFSPDTSAAANPLSCCA